MKIALLGAESTGKSQLAGELAAHLDASGQNAIAVSEYLREWCEREGCTPQPENQAHIAQTQQARIEAATSQASWVIADTTPLMTAVYSEFIFSDKSLHHQALAYQRSFDLTLVTGLDMPWEADGIQRDGPHVRGPVDALLRNLLQQAGIAYEVVYGSGHQRTANALNAVSRLAKTTNAIDSIALHADLLTSDSQKDFNKWQWNCEKCSDPDCEHRLFRSLQLAT
ncbi:MAG: AAA family ATPase [Brachymonas sp.]